MIMRSSSSIWKVSLICLIIAVLFVVDQISSANKVLDCKENLNSNAKVGATLMDVNFKPLNDFSLCIRYQFSYLVRVNVVLRINETINRPAFQIEVYVDKIRLVIARQYRYVLLDNWFQPERWYHLCVTNDSKNNQTITVYLDGNIISEYRQNMDLEDSTGLAATVCFIDSSFFPSFKFSGKVSQLNSWNLLLGSEKIKSFAPSDANYEGNVIRWNDPNWRLHGVEEYLDMSICSPENKKSYRLFLHKNFLDSQYLCDGLNGEIFYPQTYQDVTDLYSWTQKVYEGNGCQMFWTNIWKSNKEGVVWTFYSNDSVPFSIPWAADEPNGLHFESCGGFDPEGMVDDSCEADRCSACELQENQPWILYGSCEKLIHNTNFLRQDDPVNKYGFFFRGFGSYVIKMVKSEWQWLDKSSNTIIASLNSSNEKVYPFGRHDWLIQNRSICGHTSGPKSLLLTACGRDKFTCDDGTCILHEQRCDFTYDCRDNSDEADCELVRLTHDYKTNVIPRSEINKRDPVKIVFTLTIESLNVDTEGMFVGSSYNLSCRWYENRAIYFNLKNETNLNYVEGLNNSLWSPMISFSNTIDHSMTIEDARTSAYIIKKQTHYEVDDSLSEEARLFSGSKNPVEKFRKYHSTFTCDFVLSDYPFDTQICYFKFVIRSGLKSEISFSNTSSVSYQSSPLLTEYLVGEISLELTEDLGYSQAKVKIPLYRLHGYAFINIYMPSLTMLVIGFSTLFFKVDNFEVRIMTALTTLLVSSTLFSQVAASLPKTSYFKLIDIWFLFCIFSTFFVIIFHILIDWSPRGKFIKVTSFSSKKQMEPKTLFQKLKDLYLSRDQYEMQSLGRWLMFCGLFLFNFVYWLSILLGPICCKA